MADQKQDLQKINPIKQFEQAIAVAKQIKDIVKIDVVKNRYVANYEGMSGRNDGLQVYEQESFAFNELASTKPEILECDPFSIVAGFLRASSYGLSFQGNDLSVYPRNVKLKDGTYKKMLVCEPQAHGKRRLLEKMPSIKEVRTGTLIYKGEKFVYDRKKKKVISHESIWPEPEATDATVLGAYCTIVFSDGNEEEIVVNQHELKKARAASKMTDGGDLWVKYYGEACKKTAYNRAFKEKWKKPQTDAIFTYTIPSEEEIVETESVDVTHQIDQTVVSQSEPVDTQQQGEDVTASLADSKEDFHANVNESTGEVYEEAKVETPKKNRRTPII